MTATLSADLRTKVHKVLRLAHAGGTPHEARTALLLAQRLLVEHGGMSDDEAAKYAALSAGDDDPRAGVYFRLIERVNPRRLAVNGWRFQLGQVICDNFRCYGALNEGSGLLFYGAPTDVAIAEAAYRTARRAAARECADFVASPAGADAIKRVTKPSAADYYRAAWTNTAHTAPPLTRDAAESRVRQSFYAGFVAGLAAQFLRQQHDNPTWALILLPPDDVRAAKADIDRRGTYYPRSGARVAGGAHDDGIAANAGAQAGFRHRAQAMLT